MKQMHAGKRGFFFITLFAALRGGGTEFGMRRKIREFFLLIAGTLIMTLGYIWFIVPNGLAPGGVSGIATIIHFLSGFPIGWAIILLNIPLFLFSWRTLGLDFGIKSLIGTLLLSLFIDYLPLPALITGDKLLAAIFGGALVGVGLGLVFQSGGSTGGVDIVGRLLNHKLPGTSLGTFILSIDFMVVISAGVVHGVLTALYSLITVFVCSLAIDYIQNGSRSAQAYCIISEKYTDIARRLSCELQRGVTILGGRGAYTGAERNMLMCLVIRSDIAALRRIVKEEDPRAFVFVLNASEVMGEGFDPEERSMHRRKLHPPKKKEEKKDGSKKPDKRIRTEKKKQRG